MLQILLNKDELAEIVDLIPYGVKSVSDPAEFDYPIVVKFILIKQWNEEFSVLEDIVYMVSISKGEIDQAFDELRGQRGLDGYNYAESEEDTEGQGDSDEGQSETSAIDPGVDTV